VFPGELNDSIGEVFGYVDSIDIYVYPSNKQIAIMINLSIIYFSRKPKALFVDPKSQS
jgi:hypothetical protein